MMSKKMNEIMNKIDLGLKAQQLQLRDRRWDHEDYQEQSKVIDEQITEILREQK